MNQIASPPSSAAGKVDVASIMRFRDAARQGANPASSSGQRIAHRLAKALHAIGDDMAILDGDLIDGACQLIRFMHGPWPTDEAKETVFRTVRLAAGKGAGR